MGNDDALFRYRLAVFALAKELGNVRAACRMMGIHHSTFYRWKHQLEQYGTEILRPRERHRPRMPNATIPFVEHRIVAFALGHPGFGPARVSAELQRDKWDGIVISPSGVWRVLKRHGLNTRGKRLGLVAGYAAPPHPEKPPVPPKQHLQVEAPDEYWYKWTVSMWDTAARRAGGGVAESPPSTWRPRTPGRSCGPPPETRPRFAPVNSLGGSPRTSPCGVGNYKQS